jgi:hypothetical protein
VDHPLGRQAESSGRLGVAGLAASQFAALGEEVGAGGPVDGPVDPATAEQRRVGGVDDRVDPLLGDVALGRFDAAAASNL